MTTSLQKIGFFKGPTRWLSNFHEADIIALGRTFRTTEAAYQAAKRIDDIEFHEKCASFKWAGDAMHFGRSLPITTQHWHESTKFVIMHGLTLQKFSTYPDLKAKLLATGDAYLEEGNTWGDTCWGVCNGVGKNHLGRILMEVRKTLRLIEL